MSFQVSLKCGVIFQTYRRNNSRGFAKLVEQEQVLGRAYEELDRYSWTKEELRTYGQAEKYEGTYLASLEKKFEDGEKVRIQKGEKVGFFENC